MAEINSKDFFNISFPIDTVYSICEAKIADQNEKTKYMGDYEILKMEEEERDAIFQDNQQKVQNGLMVIPPRHPLMENRPTDHIQDKIDEYQLDIELGLRGQEAITKKQIINKDIEEVMRGESYYPITLNQLETLFGFQHLKWKNRGLNYKKLWNRHPIAMSIAHLLFSIPFVVTALVMFMGISFTPLYTFCILDLFLLICYEAMNNTDLDELKVATEDVKRTMQPIPKGAKLRLKTANDAKVFDGFVIAYPNIAAKYNMQYDPAILGVTKIGDEEKWWMITYWDVKKDREKSNSQIEQFKRLKLRSYE